MRRAMSCAFGPGAVAPNYSPWRSIGRFVTLQACARTRRCAIAPPGGRSIDLEPMIRVPIVGHASDVRSERWLCEALLLDLALRRFRCPSDLSDAAERALLRLHETGGGSTFATSSAGHGGGNGLPSLHP